jgi:ssDNA-binding Zn-finger/Zn-ribbon topoisomerase 1
LNAPLHDVFDEALQPTEAPQPTLAPLAASTQHGNEHRERSAKQARSADDRIPFSISPTNFTEQADALRAAREGKGDGACGTKRYQQGKRSKPMSERGAFIRCVRCGHCATTSNAADLAGKTLRCSRCGQRQRFDLGQIIEEVYREDAARARESKLMH